MVIDASELKSCPEMDKSAIILVDEMHIRCVQQKLRIDDWLC